MPDTRTSTILTSLGVVLTAGSLWIAYSEHMRKPDESRPALDITQARVVHRLFLNFENYRLNGETDEIEIIIRNRGTVEAFNIAAPGTTSEKLQSMYRDAGKTLPLLRIPDIPPGGQEVATLTDEAEHGGDFLKTVFRGTLLYANRLNGRTYSEKWCFYTSVLEITKDFPTDPENTEFSIPLAVCPLRDK